jgi:hypothetical protein
MEEGLVALTGSRDPCVSRFSNSRASLGKQTVEQRKVNTM